MVTEGTVTMAPGTLAGVNFEDFEGELEALLREQHNPSDRAALDRERELNLYRSGSAPPTVEGSRAAVGGLFGPHARAAPEAHRLGPGDRLLSEEDMRSHPAYLSYYYSNENLNPRLPPPTLSREDWLVARRFGAGAQSLGGIGDQRRRKEPREVGGSGSSLFSVQPGLPSPYRERDPTEPGRLQQRSPSRPPPSAEWLERGTGGLIGLADVGLGTRRKNIADTLQEDFGQSSSISGHPSREDFGRSNSISGHPSRPVSRNAFDNVVDPMGVPDVKLTQLRNDMETVDNMHSGATSNGIVRVQSLGSTMSHSFASALGSSMARSTTPDPQLIRRSPSPRLPPVGGRVSDTDKKIVSNGFGGVSSCMTDCDDMSIALSGLKLSEKIIEDGQNHLQGQRLQNFADHPELLFNMHSDQSQYIQQNIINKAQTGSSGSTFPLRVYDDFSKKTGIVKDVGLSSSTSNGQINLPKRLSSTDVYQKVAVGLTSLARSSGHYQADRTNIDFAGCDSNSYSANQGLPAMLNNQIDAGAALAGGAEGQYFNRIGNQAGSGFQVPITDTLYSQYLQRASDSSAQAPASMSDPSLGRNYLGTSLMDLPSYQEACLGALLAQQKLHYGTPFLGKSDGFNNGFYDNPAFGLGMPYPSQLSGSVLPSLGPGGPLRQNDRMSRFPFTLRSATGGSKGSWNHENGITEEGFASSLLEELKNNKTRSFELSEIVGHVVEFSADQYGSRFIQQKLETASVEEKNRIFPDILPHARVLMTDVFGNYVIQKFFEHGTESQRNQLADQLMGYVLSLSLQMYGCRVIQKALEVVDVGQQTQMVSELDGSVMKCVRDQNGNHVIQKCIECVPQERIQFIISSFYGQVVPLSTHPYGCRVIQRVLEHCDDTKTQSIMMEEILQSVCTLAQDQYGNYVVQHVLQHGKQEERSAIISKLAGQIVKMSQQKFASNVVEKCLTYGTPEERQILIDEMLGTTDENEPLQAMMKDQFGNYVVQKVLETCDDHNRELIISRIKIHLNGLKKYTYGKHIVARVEKLITTGERRIGVLANPA